jgi:mannosyltransferase OCH1-like enzyme
MIPRVVWMSWKSKDVVHSDAEIIQHGLRSLMALNPEWRVDISTDEEIDQYLRAALGKDYALVHDIGVVPQTDIWRLLKLYSEGGVYLDLDRLCNVRLSDAIDPATRWVLPTCGDTDFSHDVMMSAPGNPAFENTINMYLERRRAGHTNVYFLGPQTYMHGVTYTLCGEIINSNPGSDVFDELRTMITNTGFIKTYRESPPGDTLLYQGPITEDQWETMKRRFYADNKIKHWTGEW